MNHDIYIYMRTEVGGALQTVHPFLKIKKERKKKKVHPSQLNL